MQELLNELFKTGLYVKLLKVGLVSPKIATYRDYFLYVDAQIRTRGIAKTKAFKEAAGFYNVDEKTIRTAYNSLSQ